MSHPRVLRIVFARRFARGFAPSFARAFASPPMQTSPIPHRIAVCRAAALPTSLRYLDLRT